MLIDGASGHFGGMAQAIAHLLFGGEAILLDCTQAKSEEDEARQNDQDCESPEHVSHGNSGNSGGV